MIINELIIKLDRCFECDTIFLEKKDDFDGLEQAEKYKHDHHVIPQVNGGTKTVPLCTKCHDKVHNTKLLSLSYLSRKSWANVERCLKENGDNIQKEFEDGTTIGQLSKKYKIRPKSIAKFLKKGGYLLPERKRRDLLSDDEKRKILDFYKPHYPIKKMARELKIKHDLKVITEFLKKEGVYKPLIDKYNIKKLEINLEEIKLLFKNGATNKEISLKYNAPMYSVGKFKRKHNLCTQLRLKDRINEQEFRNILAVEQDYKKIIKYFNISPTSLYRLCDKFGIRFRIKDREDRRKLSRKSPTHLKK